MAIKWTNKRDIDRTFKSFEERYNSKAIQWLLRLGEIVVKKARENGSYQDQTANLRNSIGYIVVHNGNVVSESFTGNTSPRVSKGSDQSMAHNKGSDYAKEIANSLDKNKTYLVWVAGMEYATAVEAKGYDVIQGSGDWLESEAENQMQKFRRFLLGKQ